MQPLKPIGIARLHTTVAPEPLTEVRKVTALGSLAPLLYCVELSDASNSALLVQDGRNKACAACARFTIGRLSQGAANRHIRVALQEHERVLVLARLLDAMGTLMHTF